jgi:hypothetical protein
MKAWFIFSWHHFSIGLRWNPRIKRLQVFPLPCCGLVVDFNGEREDIMKSTVAMAYTLTFVIFIFIASTIFRH